MKEQLLCLAPFFFSFFFRVSCRNSVVKPMEEKTHARMYSFMYGKSVLWALLPLVWFLQTWHLVSLAIEAFSTCWWIHLSESYYAAFDYRFLFVPAWIWVWEQEGKLAVIPHHFSSRELEDKGPILQFCFIMFCVFSPSHLLLSVILLHSAPCSFWQLWIESSSAMDNLQAYELDCREIFSCSCFHL